MRSPTQPNQVWNTFAEDWAELMEPLFLPLHQAMLAVAQVRQGTRLLDVGCGTGGLCVLAAQRGAQVSGLDAAEGMLAIARLRVPAGQFHLGDQEALPYAARAFAVVTMTNTLQHARHPDQAVRELRRVCQPGGRVVIGHWGPQEQCEAAVILEAVTAHQSSAPDQAPALDLTRPGTIEALLEGAALTIRERQEVACPWDFPTAEGAWKAQRARGPIQEAILRLGEGPVQALVLRALEPYRTAQGGYHLANQIRSILATV
jgi:2-polyprenyl-3-methyl-5-hydroxy-6-metoxy-1,4-benzoquinol methylase